MRKETTIAALRDPATKYEEEDTKALLWCPLAQPYESLGQIYPWFNMAVVSGVNSRKKFSLSLPQKQAVIFKFKYLLYIREKLQITEAERCVIKAGELITALQFTTRIVSGS